MPNTLTDTSTFSSPITAPADGDDCDEASVEGGAAVALQGLANRTRYLKDHVDAAEADITALQSKVWPQGAAAGRLEVYLFGGGSITVGPIDALALSSASAPTPRVVQTGDITTYTPSALAASTLYYLYAYLNAGALALEHSTTGPALDSKRYKAGDATRRYLATFRTDADVNVMPFFKVGGRYTYLRYASPGGPFASDNMVLAGGASATFVDVDLSPLVPAHVYGVHLDAYLAFNAPVAAGNLLSAYVRTKGQAGDDGIRTHAVNLFSQVAGVPIVTGNVPIYLQGNTARKVQYRVTDAAHGALTLFLSGYEDVV